MPRYWMVCDDTKSPCLFDEDTALRRGDPPRCIRHGALLFNCSHMTGMSRADARRQLDRELGREDTESRGKRLFG